MAKRVPTAAPRGTLLVRVALTPGLDAAQGEATSTPATRPAKPATAQRIMRSKGTQTSCLGRGVTLTRTCPRRYCRPDCAGAGNGLLHHGKGEVHGSRFRRGDRCRVGE